MKIEIYGKKNCVYCTEAQEFLNRKGWVYTYTDLFSIPPEAAQSILEKANMRSLPIIFVDGTAIGGNEALQRFIISAEQRKM